MFLEAIQSRNFGTQLRAYFRAMTPGKPESDSTRLLTVREAADMLRVNKTTLYTHFIHTRQLASIQIGRRRLIPVSAVHDLIQRLRAEGMQ